VIALAACASLTAGVAHAQSGTNLTWDDCVGSGNESDHKLVACTNSGTFNLLYLFYSPTAKNTWGQIKAIYR